MAMKRVVAFGVFDVLHPGHVAFLKESRKLGDELVVVVSRDSRVKKEKGRMPIFSEDERLALVKELKPVDRAILGESSGKWTLVHKLKPNIIVLGHDQSVDDPDAKEQISSLPKTVKIVTIKRLGSNHHTSTRIKKLIYDRRKTSSRKP